MNALTIIDPHARARAIRAKFFPPVKPVNWITNPPQPAIVDEPPVRRVIIRAPGAEYDWHVMDWRRWRAETTATPFQKIMKAVAIKHGCRVADLIGKSQRPEICAARFEVMYRARDELGWPQTTIGSRLGGRDGTTILHGIRAHATRHGLAMPGRSR